MKEGLGRGAFGTVFKGILVEDKKVIAVKRLDKELIEGETEFHTEIKIIGTTYHLVRLLYFHDECDTQIIHYDINL